MISPQVITQIVQRFLVKLYSFIHLLFLAVILQQYLKQTHTIRMLLWNSLQSLLGIRPRLLSFPHFEINFSQLS